MNLYQHVEGYREAMTLWRHQIHSQPEVGFQEFKTTKFVEEELKRAGITLRSLNTGTGVLGVLKGERGPGPVVVLRADMDALPMQEETGLPYASQNPGVMHACGHDGHTATLLGTAHALAAIKEQLCGEVRFLFQPAEETLAGAQGMIEAGVLDDPPADYIAALHGSSGLNLGQVTALRGPAMASADKFTVTFTAAGGHGGYPHQTRDPILTAAHFVTAVQEIVSRQVNALDSAVVSVCAVEAGTAFNIIPRNAVMRGTIRTLNKAVRDQMEDRLREKAAGVAATFGCDYEVDFVPCVPPVVNDSAMVDRLYAAVENVLGPNSIVETTLPVMGSEDFALYSEKVPKSLFFQIGILEPGTEPIYGHNSRFDYHDGALVPGAAVFCQLVWDLLGPN